MAQVEIETTLLRQGYEGRGKSFSEKFWSSLALGTVLVVAVVALVDFLGPQISALERSLDFVN